MAIFGVLKITAFAGRFMPVLSVEVATSTSSVLFLKPFSMIDFSSLVSPEWW